MSSISFNSIRAENGQRFISVFANGTLTTPADDSHPNFSAIVAACETMQRGEDVDAQAVLDLFDIAATVTKKFQRVLSERVSVKDGVILLDGDPAHGVLQDQILKFLDSGEDFAPLVNFYEKLATNPLGDVRESAYAWMQGQGESGGVTITPEGDLLGYKAVRSGDQGYRPSRKGEGIVNGRDVPVSEFIWQKPGDVVEMPRSKVLNAPSQACGDGLHIGTWGYASTFQRGTLDTVLLVRFSPRDIVSVPTTANKIRVCRYTVVGPVTEPLSAPVFQPVTSNDLDVAIRDQAGRFSNGRPGSKRGPDGRFAR